jgi:serine/threonine protein kinase
METSRNKLLAKVMFVLTVVKNISCLKMTCEEAVKFFGRYECAQDSIMDHSENSISFRVRANDHSFMLRVQEIRKPYAFKQAISDLNYLRLFKESVYVTRMIEFIDNEDYIIEVLEIGSHGTLDSYYKDKKSHFSDKKFVLNFFLKIVESVSFIHSHGVVHTNLNLSNIVVTDENEPNIFNFSLAVPINQESSRRRGSLETMDPIIMMEIDSNTVFYNEFRDVYSLGVILYFLTQNRYPFEGIDVSSISKNISKGKYRLRKGTSFDIANLIHSCLMINEKDRTNIQELIDVTVRGINNEETNNLIDDVIVSNDQALPGSAQLCKSPQNSQSIQDRTLSFAKKYWAYMFIGLLILSAMSLGLIARFSKKIRDPSLNLEIPETRN